MKDWIKVLLGICGLIATVASSFYILGTNQPRIVALTLEVRDGDNVGFWVDTNKSANLDLTLSGNGTFTILRNITLHTLVIDRSAGHMTIASNNATIDLAEPIDLSK